MSLFFIAVFAIYGSVHAYVFVRARSTFGFGIGAGAAVALFMLLMTLAPFLIRALELHDYERSARSLSFVAYVWMAALFLFFCSALLFDAYNLLVRVLGWLTGADLSAYRIADRLSFGVSLAVAVMISIYGYVDALTVRTAHIRIETKKLPEGVDRLSIVQISDVHLGLIVRRSRLKRIMDAVRKAQPDMFISTGDLVDAQINHMTGLAELLREVKPRYGAYAITGNHEFYAGIRRAVAFTEEAGFRVLRNESVAAGPLVLVGVDDRTGVQLHVEKPVKELTLYSGISREKYTLSLKHQPVIDRDTVGFFDLQLSGHTHKGQIFPFTLATMIFYPYNAGTYDLGRGSLIHVSRGTGTWGPPIRFLSPPEVTVYELVRTTST